MLASLLGTVTVAAIAYFRPHPPSMSLMYAFPADAYAECYPSYYDYGTVMEDSDDEGGRGVEQVGLRAMQHISPARECVGLGLCVDKKLPRRRTGSNIEDTLLWTMNSNILYLTTYSAFDSQSPPPTPQPMHTATLHVALLFVFLIHFPFPSCSRKRSHGVILLAKRIGRSTRPRAWHPAKQRGAQKW